MGTGSNFDRVPFDELQIHAAWLPVTNSFRLGDYGLVTDVRRLPPRAPDRS